VSGQDEEEGGEKESRFSKYKRGFRTRAKMEKTIKERKKGKTGVLTFSYIKPVEDRGGGKTPKDIKAMKHSRGRKGFIQNGGKSSLNAWDMTQRREGVLRNYSGEICSSS